MARAELAGGVCMAQDQSEISLIRDGLPRTLSPARVIVVGAGMAGLVAAKELRRAGHDVVVLEAQQRVGGRVQTFREPFSSGLHGEAGAMRIPRTHELTLAYVEHFGLSVSPFTASNPQGYEFIHGTRRRIIEAEADPGALGFELQPDEAGKSAAQLWGEAVSPLAALVKERGAEAWDEIARQYDRYSLREYLEVSKLSEGAIEMVGLVMHLESLMNLAFLEVLREEVGEYFQDVVAIDGGMDRLPAAFTVDLADVMRFGAKAVAIEQSPDGVVVHYRTGASYATGGSHEAVGGDYAIVALPFSVVRHIEFPQGLSRGKEKAIRQLYYDAATKIFFQCRRRFWEEDDGIYGGASVTDLPVRAVYYPDHGRETGRGVLLASYTWGQDAQRWGSLSPAERTTQAIEDIARIHPQVRVEFEVSASKVWHDDEFAGGAFASFAPGQQSLLHGHIALPEGRVHFAGEHASLTHGWIQGAIESGLRAAREVHASTAG